MKNHIAFKFIAVLLCALTMLTAILSVIGIVLLESQELYEQDLEQEFALREESVYTSIARELARNYASQTLGGCDEALIDALYGTDWQDVYLKDGYFFYTIRDAAGNEYSTYSGQSVEDTFTVTVDFGSYIRQIAVVESKYGDDNIGSPLIVPTDTSSESEYDTIHIYSDKLGIYLAYQFEWVDMAEVTVTLYLMEGARKDANAYEWALLLWNNRYNLFYILAGSLLVFAIGAVYLCCAAGRKPGSDEIRPGGFNALSLDLYAVLAALVMALSWWLAEELAYSWSSRVVATTAALLFLAFFDCLVFVGFCFACAAQFKEGNGRWWRKSAIGFAVTTLWAAAKNLLGLLVRACRWLRSHVPSALGKFFGGLVRLVLEIWCGLKKIVLALWDLLKRACIWLWTHLGRLAVWAWRKLSQGLRWLGHKANRFLSMLPVTWQWMLAGLAVMLVLFLAIAIYNSTLLILGCVFFLCLILYGSHAFGLLLEAAKRMGQGDLETKVDDRLLVGSFREFAGDLNALADVAKVAAQKEMKSERMKTELITNVSHDIKTPLTSIINYVDLLQKPHTPEEEQQYLEVLGRKSEQLKKLIQDLMEMSKASTGNMAVDIRAVDAVEAVNQALGEFSDKLAASNLTPVFTPAEESVTMLADGRLVWRVLNNLLSNAVKYAMPGTRLYIDLVRRGGNVCISLKNISAQPLNVDADELMERFVRGDAARNTDGSGLGLNIAKSLMEVQHGSLELTIDGDLFKAAIHFPAE